MSRHRTIRATATAVTASALLAAALIATPSLSAATAAGWTPPQPIPRTGDLGASAFATAPNGADLTVGQFNQNGKLISRLRPPGQNTWITVPMTTTPVELNPVRDLTMRAAPNGDFWLSDDAFDQATGKLVLFTRRLDHRTWTWSKPIQVFGSPDYTVENPQLAIGGDGSVVIAGDSVVTTDIAAHRAVVAVKRPGDPSWHRQFLSPADQVVADTIAVAANQSGQLVVCWRSNTNEEISAAVLGSHSSGPWTTQAVAPFPLPSASNFSVALGADGTAALAFHDDSGPAGAVEVALQRVGAVVPWTVTTAATPGASSTFSGTPLVTVSNDGTPTVAYARVGALGTVTETTTRVAGAWAPPTPLSAGSGETSTPDALVTGEGGSAVVLYEQRTPGAPVADLGLRVRTITGSTAGPVQTVSTSSDPVASVAQLGITAAGRPMVEWQSGPLSGSVQVTSGPVLTAPQVVADAFDSTPVRHTVVSGQARVGHRLSCGTGYWVEARKLSFTWLRDGHRLPGAMHSTYRVRRRDTGHRLACMATASNASTQHTVLTGAPVEVG